MKYKFEIKETLSTIKEIEADSKEEAIDKIQNKYYNQEIVLEPDSFNGVEFNILEPEIKNNIKLVADKKFIQSLITSGALDDLEEYQKMSTDEKNNTIKYWQENYFNNGDYSEKEVQKFFKENNFAVIYKIESDEVDSPKKELVTVLNETKDLITVRSIFDDYTFDYEAVYFNKNKLPATMEDINSYKFEQNKSLEKQKKINQSEEEESEDER